MTKIIIIGGGLAGLTAAYSLVKSKSFEVTVIEKSDRLGGRVMSTQLEDRNVDLGGFIIPKWYKYYRKLISELGLNSKLVSFRFFKELYYFEQEEKIFSSIDVNINFKEKLKLALAILGSVVSGGANFYNPNLRAFNGQSFQSIIEKALGVNHPVIQVYNTVFEGYTYPDSKHIPASLLFPFIIKLAFSYLDKSEIFNGNTMLVIDALEKEITKGGGNIQKNTEVTEIANNYVVAGGVKYIADSIIYAANPDTKLLMNLISAEFTLTYTGYYCAFVKLNAKAKINNSDEWTAVYLKQSNSPSIKSLYNMFSVSENYSSEIIGVYISTQRSLDVIEIKSLINQTLKSLMKDTEVVKVLSIQYWPKCMPIVTRQTLELFRKNNGKGNLYFAGDFMGFPSMETAVYNGYKVSELIKKNFHFNH